MKKNELNEIIKSYKDDYKKNKLIKRIINRFVKHIDLEILQLLIFSQKYKYYKEKSKNTKNCIFFLLYLYYGKRYFKKSRVTNCEIYSELGKNTKIYHGGVIINDKSIIGDNVKFHGHNCVGNNGKNDAAPRIGNNVDIGIGSIIIGNVILADDIIIGANTIVTKSFLEPGITIVGNPARKIDKN